MTRPIKRVAIIGAGPTGLAQLKNILDTRSLGNRAYELEAVVFESKPDVGGVWYVLPFIHITSNKSSGLKFRYSTDEPKKYKRAVVHNDWKGKGKEEEQMYLYPPPSDDPSPMYEGLRTNLPKVRSTVFISPQTLSEYLYLHMGRELTV
jgi:cation diffusion facilitator CzcD-associated flavoprotein CzcO